MMKKTIQILLIEDNPGDARLISELLKEFKLIDYRLTNSTTLNEGLKLIQHEKFDIILLDLNLPDSYGQKTYDNIHAIYPDIPIILVSGLDEEDLSLNLIIQGAQDYINKSNITSRILEKSISHSLERNKMLTSLKESEANFRNLTENLKDGILIAPADGKHIYANQQACDLLGYRPDEILHTSQKDLADPEAYPMLQQRLHDRIAGLYVPSSYETIIRRKDGTCFPAEISGTKTKWQGLDCDMVLFRDITDRKRAEKEIIKNEHFLKTITSEVQEVIYALDAQGVFTFSEGKGLQKLGLKSGQVVGMSVFEFYKDFPEIISTLKEALNGQAVKTEGLEVGNLKFNTTYQPIFDENGTVKSVVGLAVDVTEAKKAAKALKEHAIRLQALLELNQLNNAPFATILDIVLDASQKMTGSEFSFVGMVDPNETTLTIHRWSKGVMEQCKVVSDGLNFNVADTGLLCECIRTHQPVIINDYKNPHPSKKGIPMGHVPMLRMLAVPVLEDGRVVSVITIANKPEDYTTDDALGITALLNKMMEIKKWQEANETLESHYALLNALINSPGDILIFSLDINYQYTAFNERHRQEMKKVWNADIEEGMNILDYMYVTELREMAKISIDRVLKGEVFSEIQYQPDADIYYEFSWNPIVYIRKIVGVTVFIKDITERRRSELEVQDKNEELQKLNAEKDKFFSIIAHDLRSPFNSIVGFSEHLVDEVKEKNYDGIEEYAKIIQQSSQRAMDLLMNLMEWSLSQTGRMEFNPEYFKLMELINEVCELSNDAALQKSIHITKTSISNTAIFADKAMISTILRNLIANAIKFTHPGGEINISVSESSGCLKVSVTDNGVGISKDRLKKIFQIDESYSTPGTRNEKGTGLGLILCKEFIEKHKGKIWATSETGKGSILSFTLPGDSNQNKINSNLN